ncbi:hypothetical protein [Furfurilactobacillus curtus]|uniref:Uncharacterized protein n=1 Tax=Furfurilactobacillus curtus TaxID=1746200 RepID=A0ABQ5JPH6_9LACO
MDQLLPNTYTQPQRQNHALFNWRQSVAILTHQSLRAHLVRFRQWFWTGERGDTLVHPQMPADQLINLLNGALSHHAVISVMLNSRNPFAKKLPIITGTLQQQRHSLILTNHSTDSSYVLLPEQVREICYGMMVA